MMVPYLLMTYGGIRSPDCEVVFRAGESFAETGTLEVRQRLETWYDFGVARGVDGKDYSIFGPQASVLSAPLIRFGRALNETAWYERAGERIPVSFFVGQGLHSYLDDTRVSDMKPHALRLVVSVYNVIVGALAAGVFGLIVLRMSHSRRTSSVMAVLMGLGTLAWPYSGTFFSEPGAMLFTLLSFLPLVSADATYREDRGPPSTWAMVLSGASLGAAVTAHITAILFVPFFFVYAAGVAGGGHSTPGSVSPGEGCVRFASLLTLDRGAWWRLVGWSAGCALGLAAIAWYDQTRFGNPFETGRTADLDVYARLMYGHFRAPWAGLRGLLFSSGKGLLLFSPAVIGGLLSWPRFHRTNRLLAMVLAAMAVTRLLFVASRSDWHGGFCLGPRYLVILIPFLLLPMVPVVSDWIEQGDRLKTGLFVLFTFACVSQQAYFCLGEVISYYYEVKMALWDDRVLSLFKDDLIYRDWRLSPLTHSLNWRRGPFLLQQVPLSDFQLWVSLVVAAGLGCLLMYRTLLHTSAPGRPGG